MVAPNYFCNYSIRDTMLGMKFNERILFILHTLHAIAHKINIFAHVTTHFFFTLNNHSSFLNISIAAIGYDTGREIGILLKHKCN